MIHLIAYACFCVLFAKLNAYLIGKDKRIFHGLNGAVHLVIIGLLFTVNWRVGLSGFFVGRVFFDWPLNLFRGLPLDYVPAKPKSIVDKIEKKIFGNNGLLPKIIYLLVVAALAL